MWKSILILLLFFVIRYSNAQIILFYEGFDTVTTVQNWTQQKVMGNLDFKFTKRHWGGYDPDGGYWCYPYKGTHYVAFDAGPDTMTVGLCGTYQANLYAYGYYTSRLVSPAISTMASTYINVEFYWFVNPFQNESSVIVQWSTDGVTWNNAAEKLRTDDGTSFFGWVKKSYPLPSGALNQNSLYIGFLFDTHYGSRSWMDELAIISSPVNRKPVIIKK